MSPNLSPGARLGHYEVRSQIGAGGMGEVYLAQDTKLDRKVALKILPAHLATNQDRMRRFVQEAKAAAALHHPNIAHIYEIGKADGVNFIAMEFIDGITNLASCKASGHGRHNVIATKTSSTNASRENGENLRSNSIFRRKRKINE